MIGDKCNFLLLNNFQGENVGFGNGKQGEIKGIRKVGLSPSQCINNVYYVVGLKHNLLSVSQMCDKRMVCFLLHLSAKWQTLFLRSLYSRERHKNLYKVDIKGPKKLILKCFSAMSNESILWHKRVGHDSFSMIKKLISKELVLGYKKERLMRITFLVCVLKKICQKQLSSSWTGK